MRLKVVSLLKNISSVVYCFIMFIIIALPLYMCFINSFKPNVEIFGDFIRLPKSVDFSNFTFLFRERHMFRYVFNSFAVTIIVTLIVLIINPFIAYKIAINWDKRFFKFCYFVISSAMFVPSQVLLFPLIQQYYTLNLMNPTGLIIYYMVFMLPQSIFMMVPHFRLFQKNYEMLRI